MEFHGTGSGDPMVSGLNLGSRSGSVSLLNLSRIVIQDKSLSGRKLSAFSAV
jgi:hypothetical protein